MPVSSTLTGIFKAALHYIADCIVPGIVLFSVCPLFFVVWVMGSQILSFFSATRQLFYWLDVFFWSWYQRLVLCFVENWPDTEIYFYGDVPPANNSRKEGEPIKRENTAFICNHQCAFDWIVADIVAVRHGCLGNLRYVLKNSLRYIPVFGYIFKLHGCIFVKRGDHDAVSYRNQLRSLAKRGNYWLVIFPEGTRHWAKNRKNIDHNQVYADKYGLPTFDHVLTPRHRGFYHALQSFGDTCDAVYDATIAYEPPDWKPDGAQPDLPAMDTYLNGATRRLHIHLKRIPVSEIPKDEQHFTSWLCDRFRVKNEMLGKFFSSGGALVGDRLPEPSRLSPYRDTLPYVFAAMGLTLMMLSCEIGRIIFTVIAVFSVLFTLGWMTFVPDRFSMA